MIVFNYPHVQLGWGAYSSVVVGLKTNYKKHYNILEPEQGRPDRASF